jgi:hypothetical protein
VTTIKKRREKYLKIMTIKITTNQTPQKSSAK